MSTILEPAPAIPPRTYPRPPPSSLLPTILGVLRLLKYAGFSTAATVMLYLVYILPRLNLVLELRAALRKQHEQLLVGAHGRLLELSFERTHPAQTTHVNADQDQDVPAVSLPYARHIRATLARAPEQRMTFEDLLKALGDQLPWLQNGSHHQHIIARTINDADDIRFDDDQGVVVLAQVSSPAQVQPSTSVVDAVQPLPAAIVQLRRQRDASEAAQSLADLNSYITSQSYAHSVPYFAYRTPGVSPTPHGQSEDEIRREIRALKSLLLNRRSFIPRFGPVRSATSPSTS